MPSPKKPRTIKDMGDDELHSEEDRLGRRLTDRLQTREEEDYHGRLIDEIHERRHSASRARKLSTGGGRSRGSMARPK